MTSRTIMIALGAAVLLPVVLTESASAQYYSERDSYLAQRERDAARAGDYGAAERYQRQREAERRVGRFTDSPRYRDSGYYSSWEYRRKDRRRRRLLDKAGS